MRSMHHLVWALVAACCMAAGGPAAAQPLVGQVVERAMPTGRGYDIPLPDARWQVTAVTELKSGPHDFRVFTLRDVDPQARMPYLFVRHAMLPAEWTSTCDKPNPSAFSVDTYFTQSNALFARCTRLFASGLPKPDATDWWAGLHRGVLDADTTRLTGQMLMSELSVTQHRGIFVRVEALLRVDGAGLSAGKMRDAWRAGQTHPWISRLQQFNGAYVHALEEVALKKRAPGRTEAFEPPPKDLDEQIRRMASTQPREAPMAVPTAPPPAPVNDAAVTERIRQMAQAHERERMPVPAPASLPLSVPVPQPSVSAGAQPAPAPVVQAAAQPPAQPGVSAADLARLAAEIARLRDELKSRPPVPAVPPAAMPAPPPAAAGLATQARRVALVIGNDAYQSVARLQNARTDARAMAEALGRTGYKVRLRTDLGERAMKDELRAFKAEIQGGDEVLFYFAGHGVQLSGANYLLPTDIRGEAEDQVRDDALLLQKVLDDLQERKARFALAIVDACRDNPFRTAGRNLGGRGLAPTTAATGQMVMFSAGAGQQALDRLGERDTNPNGLFTRVLLKEMDKPAVSVDRVLRAVRNQVVELAKSVGHEQVPALYDQSVGEFYLRR
jgi:hypothetical protein